MINLVISIFTLPIIGTKNDRSSRHTCTWRTNLDVNSEVIPQRLDALFLHCALTFSSSILRVANLYYNITVRLTDLDRKRKMTLNVHRHFKKKKHSTYVLRHQCHENCVDCSCFHRSVLDDVVLVEGNSLLCKLQISRSTESERKPDWSMKLVRHYLTKQSSTEKEQRTHWQKFYVKENVLHKLVSLPRPDYESTQRMISLSRGPWWIPWYNTKGVENHSVTVRRAA